MVNETTQKSLEAYYREHKSDLKCEHAGDYFLLETSELDRSHQIHARFFPDIISLTTAILDSGKDFTRAFYANHIPGR